MASKISINLDTSKENFLVAKCKQNDDLTLEASIFENGLEKNLTNAAITIQALKADKTYIIQNTNITKENNKIIANLDRDFTRAAGKTEIEIVLVESSKQNTTFSFCLEVVGSVIRGAVESSNTVTILEELGNKIVEAGQVRDETEQLIQSGGAATKGDIQEINSHLEQKASKIGVTYADFGAKGDGITNDYKAIYDAHIFANEHGCKVFGDGTKTYLLGDKGELPPIPIKTNTDWCGATFIIDDRNLISFDDVFDIGQVEKTKVTTTGNISIGQKTIDLPDGIYSFYNSKIKQFIRSGSNADLGYPQQDTMVVINKKILTDTPQNINYDSYEFKPITNKKLLIKNGYFITKQKDTSYGTSIYRGIRVTENNVIFDNIRHKLQEEKDYDTYNGFIILDMVYNTIFKNSSFPRHTHINSSPSYELNFSKCAFIYFDNVSTEDLSEIIPTWHMILTNNCKDIKIINSTIDCFDAHMGVVNLSIKDSVIGEGGIRVVGWGILEIENNTLFGQNMVSLRGDYGSFWNGKIILRKNKHKVLSGTPKFVSFQNTGLHNYGYETYCGTEWIIEDNEIFDEDLNISYNFIVQCESKYIGSGLRPWPLLFPSYIKVKNNKSSKGYRVFNSHINNILMKDNKTFTDITNMKENMIIEIDNINLLQFESGIGNGNISVSEFNSMVDFQNTPNMCLPKIIFKNCENLWCNPKGYPMLLEIDNCSLKTFNLFGANTQYVSKGNVNNSVFNISPSSVAYYIRANYEYVEFNNCDFNIEGNYEITDLRTIMTFIDYLKPGTGDKKLIGHFNNCNMWSGFDWNLNGDYSIYGFDMNEEFKRWYTRTCKTV